MHFKIDSFYNRRRLLFDFCLTLMIRCWIITDVLNVLMFAAMITTMGISIISIKRDLSSDRIQVLLTILLTQVAFKLVSWRV